jgi:hypothetical protein
MAYNKFKKLEQLRKSFGITDIQTTWLPQQLSNFLVSQHLLDDLHAAKEETLGTEKAKSEYIITPILKELRKHNKQNFKSFSGYEFNVDKKQGLNGFCDFILSLDSQKSEITAPVFCLVEAKNAEIDRGYAQCGAEMYAAQIFNEQEGLPNKIIYGCVTNAFSWCFLKLEGKNLYIDTDYVPLSFGEPHKVLAVLQWILEVSLAMRK